MKLRLSLLAACLLKTASALAETEDFLNFATQLAAADALLTTECGTEMCLLINH